MTPKRLRGCECVLCSHFNHCAKYALWVTKLHSDFIVRIQYQYTYKSNNHVQSYNHALKKWANGENGIQKCGYIVSCQSTHLLLLHHVSCGGNAHKQAAPKSFIFYEAQRNGAQQSSLKISYSKDSIQL